MKNTAYKDYMQFFFALLVGMGIETGYFTVIESVTYYLPDSYFLSGLFCVYIIMAGIVIAIVINKYCQRKNSLLACLKAFVALIGGLWLHYMIMRHDSVVYYHMHGKFMPLSVDLGFYFFMLYLGVGYLIWIPEVIWLVIKNLTLGRQHR